MPRRPKTPCKYPGCPRLVPYGRKYCEEHERQCQGDRLVPATVVDHIKPHRGDAKLFWDETNWQPLCKSCHDHKTMTEDRNIEYKY